MGKGGKGERVVGRGDSTHSAPWSSLAQISRLVKLSCPTLSIYMCCGNATCVCINAAFHAGRCTLIHNQPCHAQRRRF